MILPAEHEIRPRRRLPNGSDDRGLDDEALRLGHEFRAKPMGLSTASDLRTNELQHSQVILSVRWVEEDYVPGSKLTFRSGAQKLSCLGRDNLSLVL